LKILSETEKQLRISKNQTTWFTVALLQLSSVDYQSVDANDTKFSLRGACNGGELNLFPWLVTLFSIPFLLGVLDINTNSLITLSSQVKTWSILQQACVLTSHTD